MSAETVFDAVRFELCSINGADLAFGHKSALDLQSAIYNLPWSFSGASACRNPELAGDVAGVKIVLHTVIRDLVRRGLLNQ